MDYKGGLPRELQGTRVIINNSSRQQGRSVNMKLSPRMPLQAWKCRLLTHWMLLIILVFATFMCRVVLKGRVSACCLTTLGSCLATSSGLPSISPVVLHLKRSSRTLLHYEVKTKLSSARGFSALQNIQVSIVSDGEQTIACSVSLTFLNLTVSWNFYLGEFVHVCERGELQEGSTSVSHKYLFS